MKDVASCFQKRCRILEVFPGLFNTSKSLVAPIRGMRALHLLTGMFVGAMRRPFPT